MITELLNDTCSKCGKQKGSCSCELLTLVAELEQLKDDTAACSICGESKAQKFGVCFDCMSDYSLDEGEDRMFVEEAVLPEETFAEEASEFEEDDKKERNLTDEEIFEEVSEEFFDDEEDDEDSDYEDDLDEEDYEEDEEEDDEEDLDEEEYEEDEESDEDDELDDEDDPIPPAVHTPKDLEDEEEELEDED